MSHERCRHRHFKCDSTFKMGIIALTILEEAKFESVNNESVVLFRSDEFFIGIVYKVTDIM